MDRLEKGILLAIGAICLGLVLLLLARPDIFLPSVKQIDPFPKGKVATVRIVMPQASWQRLMANPLAEQYVRADFWFEGQRYPNVAVRPKGNSSLMSAAGSGSKRLSFKVDFNMLNKAQTFCGVKKLSLNNGWSDPTLIREALAYEVFEQMGIPVPRTAFVDLWINDMHLGLYTQVEQIDKTFLARYFPNPSGNLYKPEFGAAGLNWTREDAERQAQQVGPQPQQRLLEINLGGSRLAELIALLEAETSADTNSPGPMPGFGPPPMGAAGQPLGPPAPGFQPMPPAQPPFGRGMPGGRGFGPGRGPFGGGLLVEAVGLKTNENLADHQGLFRLLDVLNRCPEQSFPEQIGQIFDVDLWLRYLAVSVAIVHLDNYIGMGHNYYLYESQGRFTVLPWDLNMAFGTFNMGIPTAEPADYPIDQPSRMSDRPLAARILAYKPFLDRYHQYLRQLLDGPLAPGVLESRIEQLSQLVRPYVPQEQLADFDKGLDQGGPYSGSMGPGPRGLGFGRMPFGPPDVNRPGPPGMFGQRPGDPNIPMGFRPRPMGGPGGFMNAPGLKAFLARRRLSIRQQLDGQMPSIVEQPRMFGFPPGGQPRL